MAEMTRVGVPMSKETLLALLEDIRHHVEKDDSWEGNLEYLMPDELTPSLDDGTQADFVVGATYRVGNATAGQGFMRVIGSWEETTP